MLRSRLASLMADNDIRQDELHNATGISKATLSNIANNKTTAPQYGTIETLAMFFNVSPDKLFEYSPYRYEITLENDNQPPYLESNEYQQWFHGLELKLTTERLSVRNMPFSLYVDKDFQYRLLSEIALITNEFDHFLIINLEDSDFNEFLDNLSPAFLKQFTHDFAASIKDLMGPVLSNNGFTGTLLFSMGENYNAKYQFTLNI